MLLCIDAVLGHEVVFYQIRTIYHQAYADNALCRHRKHIVRRHFGDRIQLVVEDGSHALETFRFHLLSRFFDLALKVGVLFAGSWTCKSDQAELFLESGRGPLVNQSLAEEIEGNCSPTSSLQNSSAHLLNS